MSPTTFAGSTQFAAAAVLAVGGQPLTAVAAALLLNARFGRPRACYAGLVEDPGFRDSPPPDPRSAEAISWLLLGVMAAAVVIGLFLMLRIG